MAAALVAVGMGFFLWPEKPTRGVPSPNPKRWTSLYHARETRGALPWNRNRAASSHVLSIANIDGPAMAELRAATLGTSWGEEEQLELKAFSGWAKLYLSIEDRQSRQVMEAKGENLAEVRREAMVELIRSDPETALASAVPVTVRRQLPAKIQRHLESRISATGTLSVQAAVPDGTGPVRESLFRTAMVADNEYRAHVYGDRARHRTRAGIALNGIAVGRDFAVSDSSGRVLEPGETTLPRQPRDRKCTECPTDTAQAAQPVATEKAGQVRWQCCPGHARQALDSPPAFTGRRGMLSMADRSRTVGDFSVTERPRMAWTHGAKRVLLIRVDFSDLAGMPVSQGRYVSPDYAWALFQRINRFFRRASYGRTSVVLDKESITPVLRMPRPALFYARGGLNDTLHLHARQAAAAAGFAVNNYDRVGVVFSSLKWYGGTRMDYGGLANVEGRNFWVNGRLEFGSLAHELGHTYGVHHANRHRSSNRDPIGPGTTVEYGDVFDIMGNTVLATEHHDFNPWFKYLLHWLPEESVLTATGPGMYRIYRFDEEDANPNLPLALKVPRRDEASDYWIGYRRAFPQLANAAYVAWGFEENRNSILLDMRTPWINPLDAGLTVGRTFHDSAAAVSLRPVATGTDETGRSFLDVEVKMIEAPVITEQPREHQKIEPGGVLRLAVQLRGEVAVRHEWLHDGKLLHDDGRVVGASSAELTLLNISSKDAGRYTAHLVYEGGKVVSRPALVDVGAASLEPGVAWLRRQGGVTDGASRARAMATGPTGGVLLVGDFSGRLSLGREVRDASGSSDMFVARYNQRGELQWAKMMGGPGEDSATAVATDSAGNGFVAGWFFDKAEFGPYTLSQPGRYAAFVAKLDSTGRWQWARALTDEGESMASGLVVLPDGGLAVSGAFGNTLRTGAVALASRGAADAFVMRLNQSGMVMWVRGMGGSGEDMAVAVSTDANGQVMVAGSYTGDATFGGRHLTALGETDAFVAQWSAAGECTWLASEGGRGADYASSLISTGDGGWLLAGDFEGVATLGQVNYQSRGAADVFLVCYRADGVPAWSRTMGGEGPDIGGRIALARNKVIHWTASAGGHVYMNGQSLVGRGGMDICLATCSSDGSLLGGRIWGGEQDDIAAGLAVDNQGNVYLAGSASGRARFDTFTLDSPGPSVGFMMGIKLR